jgi:hypothetical protein
VLDDSFARPDDEVTRRLAALEADLRKRLDGLATVERQAVPDGGMSTVSVTPANPSSLAVYWMESAGDLSVNAGTYGGWWELDRTVADAELLEGIVRGVVAGQVVETSAFARSQVAITLPDGQVRRGTGYHGCICLVTPLPGWRRWGRRVVYEPYGPRQP